MIPREHFHSFFRSLITPGGAEDSPGILEILRPIIILMSTLLFVVRIFLKCTGCPLGGLWPAAKLSSNFAGRLVKMIFDPFQNESRSGFYPKKKIRLEPLSMAKKSVFQVVNRLKREFDYMFESYISA